MKKVKTPKATKFGDYLGIPFAYGDDDTVMFFIPKSFIETGDLSDIKITPENFFGVNIKTIWEIVVEEDK